MVTQKKEFQELFLNILHEDFSHLSTAEKERLAAILSSGANHHMMEVNKDFTALYQELALQSEITRSAFKKHIELLENYSKKIVDHLVNATFVEKKYNTQKMTTELIPKSKATMLMVEYLNHMNKEVKNYYKDVFKIEPEKNSQTVQGELF